MASVTLLTLILSATYNVGYALNASFIECNLNSTTCAIHCIDTDDCQGVNIDMEELYNQTDINITNNIHINCNGNYSCQFMEFYDNPNIKNMSTSLIYKIYFRKEHYG